MTKDEQLRLQLIEPIRVYPEQSHRGRKYWCAECLTRDHRHFIVEASTPEIALRKIIRTVLALAVLLFCSIGCAQEEPHLIGDIVRGEHQLRRIVERTSTSSHLSGFFIFGVGSIGGSSKQNSLVYFAWQLQSGEYAISQLPLTSVRVRIIPDQSMPTIRFRWREMTSTNGWPAPLLQEIMDQYIVYAVISCSEKDWNPVIQMPLGKINPVLEVK